MSKVGCVIVGDPKRPGKAPVEKFRNVAVASLDDCMNRISVVREDIRPVDEGKLLGPAFTVKTPSGNSLMFHVAMNLTKPGDAIIIDAGGDIRRPIFDEPMVTYYRECGIAGIMVDGSLRDVDTMSQLTDFPIYTRSITPDGPYKNGLGEINTPIVYGGGLVNPGFIVVGDKDSVIFTSPSDAPELLEKINKPHESEIRIINTIEGGGTYIRPWINGKLEGLEVERINYVEY